MATLANQVAPVGTPSDSYQNYVNPQWVALLNLLDMNVRYRRCAGAELFYRRRPPDPGLLSGYCAGELGERLCRLADGGLEEVYFGSSGSEGVEAAIKFARATTGRAGIV